MTKKKTRKPATKPNRKSRSLALGTCSAAAPKATGRRYSSVIAMMIGEKMSKRAVDGVKALLARDRLIAAEFYRQGVSVRKLARKYALKPLWIEDIIRVDGLSLPNTEITNAPRAGK